MKTGTLALCIWILSGILWTAAAVVASATDAAIVEVAQHTDSNTVQSIKDDSTVQVALSNEKCISINEADSDKLSELPGIGPVVSQRILEYRTRHGQFASMADLDKVKGIGPATLRKLEGRICW